MESSTTKKNKKQLAYIYFWKLVRYVFVNRYISRISENTDSEIQNYIWMLFLTFSQIIDKVMLE